MASKMEESSVRLIESFEMGFVTLRLSQLAVDAVTKDQRGGSRLQAEARIEVAIRFYLRDRDADQPAWPYPSFLRGSEVREDVELKLGIDQDLWLEFEAEAARQGVSVAQLAEHAAFYLAAELDTGRITQRILDDLASSSEG